MLFPKPGVCPEHDMADEVGAAAVRHILACTFRSMAVKLRGSLTQNGTISSFTDLSDGSLSCVNAAL